MRELFIDMKEPDARMDNTTAGVFIVDIDRRITFFNKTAAAITGIRPQEALGRHCDEILRADTCGTGCLLAHTMISGGPVCNVPTTIIRRGRKRISIGVDICLLKDGAGKVVGGMASFRDLSAMLGPSEMRKKGQVKHDENLTDREGQNLKRTGSNICNDYLRALP